MNLGTVGIVAEIIGSTAVVVSVIYLALQVKIQTQQSRLQASRELAIHWNENVSRLTEGEEFPSLYLKGAADYNSLSREEKFRFSIYVSILARTAEQQYLHVKRGSLDPVFFESSERLNAEWSRLPGVQIWWANNRDVFSAEFTAKMDELVAAAIEKGYVSSFRADPEQPTNEARESDA